MDKLPLNGIRVLDLGRFLAAPYCGQMLGDMGAEVIKVERPPVGDQFRSYGPPFLHDKEGNETSESSYFLSVNRNKSSITIDLSSPKGQRIVRNLVKQCDVLIENFKVGDLARMGLDYPTLSKINPGLIYCSITGFGQDGPYAKQPGLDSVFQAMSGLMSVTGEPDGPPQKVGVTIIDHITGLYATIAILGAFHYREVLGGGQGQHIDMALLDVAIATMTHRAQDYLLTGEVPVRSGSRTLGSAPAQVFQCKDGDINIQAGDDHAFHTLCTLLGLDDLSANPQLQTRSDRWRYRDAMLPPLERTIAQWQVDDLHQALSKVSIINAPIYTFAQTLKHEQVRHRQLVRSIRHPLGEIQLIANPIRYGTTPLDRYDAPPLLGEHTESLLYRYLGIDEQELKNLRAEGVV